MCGAVSFVPAVKIHCVTLGPVAEPYLRTFPPPQLFFRLLFDPKLGIAEICMLSCPYLSWQMVLLTDPLYRPGLALNTCRHNKRAAPCHPLLCPIKACRGEHV